MALFNVRSLSNILNYFMFLTECWLQTNDQSQLVELCPPHCDCFNQPRFSGRGGRNSLKCNQVPYNGFSSFEILTFKLGLHPILFAIIYCPPKRTGSFLAELFIDFDDSTNVHPSIHSRPLIRSQVAVAAG